jgi:hypothetical protein
MKLVRLIKMRLNEIYSEVRRGTSLSGVFSIQKGLKQVEGFSLLFSNIPSGRPSKIRKK